MTTSLVLDEKKGRATAEGTLDALNFETLTGKVYDQKGKVIEGFQRIWRPDQQKTLAIMSNAYKLVQHKEAMIPAIEALGENGWTVDTSRVERDGAAAYVQLVQRKEAAIKVVGEKVGLRILMHNTYDGSSSLRLSFGSIVLRCTNGAVMPGKDTFGFDASHIGGIRERLGFLTARVRKIQESMGERMIEAYSKLDSPVPSEIGREIIRRVIGERKVDQVAGYWSGGIGRNGEATAWNLYNGITQYLTHDYVGDWSRRERSNARAFDMIANYAQSGGLPEVADAN